MKRFCLVLAGAAVCYLLAGGTASGQPILKRVEDLLRNQLEGTAAKDTERGYFGLLGDDTADGSGVKVLEVYPDQPAARAGIEANDVITSLGGTPVRSMDDMVAVLEKQPVGARLKVEVMRAGQPRLLDVTLGRRPAGEPQELPTPENAPVVPPQNPSEPARPKLGVRAVPVTPQIQAQNKLPTASGAMVISVASGSAAERAGIPLGAIVTEVNDTTIRTPQELSAVVQSLHDDEFTLTYVHAGQTHRTNVRLSSLPADTPRQSQSARPPQPSLIAPAETPAQPPSTGGDAESRIEALEPQASDQSGADEPQ
jgi:S1-C subfamily serine protease